MVLTLLILAGCGPHMARQYALRPYKQVLPAMPPGTVPETGLPAAPAVAERNPLAPTPETLALGQRYYGYYCQHCHGADGRGQTPVGQSYNPRPTDLTTPAVQGLSDADLYRQMLTGVGHDPVLTSTVAPDRRWPLVAFLRTLSPLAPPAPPLP
jgi:mono/diheme cytochrome c family protein